MCALGSDFSASMRMLIPWFQGILLFLSRLGRAQDQDDSMMEWTTAYSLEGEHEIAKNTLLTTLPKMTKEWKVAFDINPTDYSVAGMTNLLHLTQGGNKAQVGDRIPAIWFHKSQGVIVSTAMDGKAAYSRKIKPLPPAGEWTTIEVSQTLVKSKFMFSITIGDKQVFQKRNRKPVELSDIKVYAGNPWHQSQRGSLRNLKIEIKTPIECGGKTVKMTYCSLIITSMIIFAFL